MSSLSREELTGRFATIRATLGGRVGGVRLGEISSPLPPPAGVVLSVQFSWFLSEVANGVWCGDVVLFSGAELSRNQFFLEANPEFSADGQVIGTLLYDPLVLRSTGFVFVVRDGAASLLCSFEELLSALVSSSRYLEIISQATDGWETLLREQYML